VPPGTGNWADFFDGIAASADTLTVMNGERYLGTFTAAVDSTFSTNKVNVLVEDLYGCTSLIAVSHRGKHYIVMRTHARANTVTLGVFVTHFWEKPEFSEDSVFQSDVIDLLE